MNSSNSASWLHIAVILILSFKVSSALPLGDGKLSTAIFLKEQLQAMVKASNDILEEYIIEKMECTSLVACRSLLTSLRLTVLPEFQDIQNFSYESWRAKFQNNTSGLQDFNFYLRSTLVKSVACIHEVNSHSSSGSGSDNLMRTIDEDLIDIADLLQQFIITLVADLRKTYCMSIFVKAIDDYPPCWECQQPSMPSRSIEVTRDYQFLLQFYEFLESFLNFYNSFLIISSPSEFCQRNAEPIE